ncbi:MAG: LysM domain-containing protein [Cyanobacteria bacterium]|nr:LysM domain-containing protein [Cyanobacteriota bacterium]
MQGPAEGVCWLGDLALLETPGVLPLSFALKPNRVLVLETGDSLNLIAERYGTTVQTLRAVNPDLAKQGPITTATGDTLNVLAARPQ